MCANPDSYSANGGSEFVPEIGYPDTEFLHFLQANPGTKSKLRQACFTLHLLKFTINQPSFHSTLQVYTLNQNNLYSLLQCTYWLNFHTHQTHVPHSFLQTQLITVFSCTAVITLIPKYDHYTSTTLVRTIKH